MSNTAPAPSSSSRRRPDYGLDAPGVVRNLLFAGAVGLLAVAARVAGVWHERMRAAVVLMPLMFAGLAMGLTGLLMVWHSRIGKVRERERHLDRLPWRGDETVLDVGCGRGCSSSARPSGSTMAERPSAWTSGGRKTWRGIHPTPRSPTRGWRAWRTAWK